MQQYIINLSLVSNDFVILSLHTFRHFLTDFKTTAWFLGEFKVF